MTLSTFDKASAAEPCCVQCGNRLSDSEIKFCLIEKCVPACALDFAEARSQMSEPFPMWPAGWYGHCSKSASGHWRVTDEDGGVYDWPITY